MNKILDSEDIFTILDQATKLLVLEKKIDELLDWPDLRQAIADLNQALKNYEHLTKPK